MVDNPDGLIQELVTDDDTGAKNTSGSEFYEIMQEIQDAEENFLSQRLEKSTSSLNPETMYISIHITKVSKPAYPRSNSSDFQHVKQSEVFELNERKVWKFVQKSDFSVEANILGGKFVLAVKNLDSSYEHSSARYISQGHRDKEKPYMVHETFTLRA